MDVHCIIGGALILSGVIFATTFLSNSVTIIMGILVIIKGIIEADQD
jgi:uncharacterized membrane protein HdeD (DUF308 family)